MTLQPHGVIPTVDLVIIRRHLWVAVPPPVPKRRRRQVCVRSALYFRSSLETRLSLLSITHSGRLVTMASGNSPSITPVPHYANNPSAFPMEGGCCCGYARYRLERAPIAVHCCHCTSCQRETGSAFGMNVIIESTNLTILRPGPATVPSYPGEPDAFPSASPALPSPDHKLNLILSPIPQESGKAQHTTRCPKCFMVVWTCYSVGPAVRFVRAGTLDRAWLVQPDLHLYVRSKREFVKLDDGVPQFEEFYDQTKVWSQESLDRWNELLPEIERYRQSLEKGSEVSS